ncbi:molybdopterin-dependent oxidoreductase [Gordonia rhizosphera]|nr:molybdopterin-dependent oxidoreductase [Gordonia rhizosphera]
MARTALRICPFCEATCGLTLNLDEDSRVLGARGDRDDVFSHGFICPKGASFAELDNDPDRLSRPVIRRGDEFVEAGWEEGLAAAADGLAAVIAEHGGPAVGLYLGNPNAHTVAGHLHVPLLARAIGTRVLFSASTLDQMPKQVAQGHMFGDPFAFSVPDLDRTDHLVIIGANPVVSNGSLATAADFPGKLAALRKRGGRLTVIDPAATRTTRLADTHLAPRPGTDAALLFGVVHTLFDEGLVAPDLGGIAEHVVGVDELRAAATDFAPEQVAEHCGVAAEEIRDLARAIAASPSAAVYGRIGTTTVEFGTTGSWLIDAINILTGNLDRPGGVMFPLAPTAPTPRARPGRDFRIGRWHSRVSGFPEVAGELPATALAEEIETPGPGQIRALVAVAGNPVLSAPDGQRLSRALEGIGFMLAIDPYLNETTRHADVILPPPPPSQSPHFDFTLNRLAVRASARYSPPVRPPADGRPDESAMLSRITLALSGFGVDSDPALVDEQVIATMLAKEVADPTSPVAGRDVGEMVAMIPDGPGYERRLDTMLRLGAYGDGFGARPDGLTLAAVKESPHGIDLGPMRPRLPDVLRTATGKIELAADALLADVARLRASLHRSPDDMLLIGRRHLRSNNSWMHNLPALSGGSNRCTLRIHPDDAARLGVDDVAIVKGAGGELRVAVEVTTEIRPGVVSLPHGWGHDVEGTRTSVASADPGVNVNQLNDGALLDPLSGTAVLNGVPVHVAPV